MGENNKAFIFWVIYINVVGYYFTNIYVRNRTLIFTTNKVHFIYESYLEFVKHKPNKRRAIHYLACDQSYGDKA